MKEKNMLVRALPLEVWERVEKVCRRRGMKRRDYIELALAYFEGDKEQKDHLKAMATVAQIREKVKAY